MFFEPRYDTGPAGGLSVSSQPGGGSGIIETDPPAPAYATNTPQRVGIPIVHQEHHALTRYREQVEWVTQHETPETRYVW